MEAGATLTDQALADQALDMLMLYEYATNGNWIFLYSTGDSRDTVVADWLTRYRSGTKH